MRLLLPSVGGVLLMLLVLTGCATIEGQKYQESSFEAPPERSVIVLYRQFALTGAAWPHHFYVDNRHVASLKARGFTRIVVKPGTYKVSSGPKSEPDHLVISVVAEPGSIHFVHYHPGATTGLLGVYSSDLFREVNRTEAERAMAESDYRYQPPLLAEIP